MELTVEKEKKLELIGEKFIYDLIDIFETIENKESMCVFIGAVLISFGKNIDIKKSAMDRLLEALSESYE